MFGVVSGSTKRISVSFLAESSSTDSRDNEPGGGGGQASRYVVISWHSLFVFDGCQAFVRTQKKSIRGGIWYSLFLESTRLQYTTVMGYSAWSFYGVFFFFEDEL